MAKPQPIEIFENIQPRNAACRRDANFICTHGINTTRDRFGSIPAFLKSGRPQEHRDTCDKFCNLCTPTLSFVSTLLKS